MQQRVLPSMDSVHGQVEWGLLGQEAGIEVW